MNFRNTGVMVLAGILFMSTLQLTNVQAPVPTGSANKHVRNVLTANVESKNPYQQLERILNEQIKKDLEETKLENQRHSLNLQQNISRGSNNILTGFQVTWYNNDGISHTTRSGHDTVAGVTMGVDPSVIPLGTWVEIQMPDGTILKRRAEDTGSAAHGKVLDIYANRPQGELLKRGRTHNVKIRILGKDQN